MKNASIEIDFTDKTLIEIKAFILENASLVTRSEMDNMVVQYNTRLLSEYDEKFYKCLDNEYFSAINSAKDDEYILHVENITDEAIKSDVLKMVEAGYGFEMLEGDYYLTIDYGKVYEMFGDKLSETYNKYFELKQREHDQSVFVEEYLNISFEEIKYRITTLETFIKANPDSSFIDSDKELLSWYVHALTRVDAFSGTIDYETGKVNEDVIQVYKDLSESDLKIASKVSTEMLSILEKYDFTVKMDDEEANNAISEMKRKYYDSVSTLVDEYYTAQ